MTDGKNLRDVFDRIGRPRILVLGDLILDRYTFGNAERVSPEAPVVVLRVDSKEVRLGWAASVAMLLRGLEAEVILAGIVGEDPEGRIVRSLLRDEKIDSHLVLVDPNRPSTTKERVIGRAANRHSHQIVRIDHETRDPISSALEEGLLGGIIRLLRSKPGTGSKPAPEHSNPNEADGATSREASEPLPGFDAILIADYAKGVCKPTLLQRVIDIARGSHIPVIVDPARIADYSRYAGATLCKPNRTETELATGETIASPADVVMLGQKLCREHKLGAAVITLDREGMVLVQDDGSTALFPAEPREVYDITGAGDMVLSALGLCVASDVPLPQAVHVANIAAGLEIARFGVAPVLRQELTQAVALAIPAFSGPPFDPQSSGATFQDAESLVDPKLEAQYSEQPKRGMTASDSSDDSTRPSFEFSVGSPRSLKLISLPEAISLAAIYRSQGKSLVFTNGCFDLLHVGHMSMLEQASAAGDVLIVAVNSDASVRRLKGPDRPAIPEQHRAAMLAALGYVNHVLIFDDPTPHSLLEQIRPELLVKGGTTTEIIGREVVESYGGKAVLLSEIPGISTTALLAALPPLARGGQGGCCGCESDTQSALVSSNPNSEFRTPYFPVPIPK